MVKSLYCFSRIAFNSFKSSLPNDLVCACVSWGPDNYRARTLKFATLLPLSKRKLWPHDWWYVIAWILNQENLLRLWVTFGPSAQNSHFVCKVGISVLSWAIFYRVCIILSIYINLHFGLLDLCLTQIKCHYRKLTMLIF